MIDNLPAYPAYRDSELPWVGAIPAHWDVLRNGRLFTHRVETGFPDLPILEVSLRTGVRVRDLVNLKRKQIMTQKEKYKRAVKGDIAYNMMRMWQGALGVAPTDGLVSPAYVVVRPFDEVNSAYYDYLFRTGAYMSEVNKYSRGIVSDRNRLYWDEFKQMPSIIPSRYEQDKIVAFLRAQDRQIARFIRDKRRLIELLNEQKQTIIHRAVTRGLDSNVRLRPSSIDWLGDVPEHWDVVHLGSIVEIINGYPFDSKKFNDTVGKPLVRIRDLYSKKTVVCFNGEEVAEAVIESDDLLVGMDGDFNAALWQGGRALLNQRVCCLRPKKRLNANFLSYFLPLALKYINDLTISTTVKHLSSNDLKRLRFPCPETDEQNEIVDFIRQQIAPLEETVTTERASIDLIREYRERLIGDVVTGKVDVRGWIPATEDLEADDEVLAVMGDDEEIPAEEEDGDAND